MVEGAPNLKLISYFRYRRIFDCQYSPLKSLVDGRLNDGRDKSRAIHDVLDGRLTPVEK